MLGTPACMAREQLLGEAADVRADVHALGMLLYTRVGLALWRQERWDEAAEWFLLAAELEEEHRGVHPGVVELTEYHAAALRETGRTEEAAAAKARALGMREELGMGPPEPVVPGG